MPAIWATACICATPINPCRHASANCGNSRNARANFANRAYDGYYPSLHLTYQLRENLLVRAAYARTYGRPDFANVIPNATINETDTGGADPDHGSGRAAGVEEVLPHVLQRRLGGARLVVQALDHPVEEHVAEVRVAHDGAVDAVRVGLLVAAQEARDPQVGRAARGAEVVDGQEPGGEALGGRAPVLLLAQLLGVDGVATLEGGYKAFRREIIQSVTIEEDRFGFEPEVTAKIAALHCRIYEVGISYEGRTYDEGKKIGWRDGVRAIYCIVRYSSIGGRFLR